jgi:hypothetical protein
VAPSSYKDRLGSKVFQPEPLAATPPRQQQPRRKQQQQRQRQQGPLTLTPQSAQQHAKAESAGAKGDDNDGDSTLQAEADVLDNQVGARAKAGNKAADSQRDLVRKAKADARRAAFHAAMRRALLAAMTEYSQEHYGQGHWWMPGLDVHLREQLTRGWGVLEPALHHIAVLHDAVGGWWHWPQSADAPIFKRDRRPVRLAPARPRPRLTRGRDRLHKGGAAPTAEEASLARDERKAAEEAARQSLQAFYRERDEEFRGAVRHGLLALMTDYCQAHFGGAWWVMGLQNILRSRIRAGLAENDDDLEHLRVLRGFCRGWWRWPAQDNAPHFHLENKPDAAYHRAPAPGANPDARSRPILNATATAAAAATTTTDASARRKLKREQAKRRAAGGAGRARAEQTPNAFAA